MVTDGEDLLTEEEAPSLGESLAACDPVHRQALLPSQESCEVESLPEDFGMMNDWLVGRSRVLDAGPLAAAWRASQSGRLLLSPGGTSYSTFHSYYFSFDQDSKGRFFANENKIKFYYNFDQDCQGRFFANKN